MEQNVFDDSSLQDKLLYVYKSLEAEKNVKEGKFFIDKVKRAFNPLKEDIKVLENIFIITKNIRNNKYNTLFLRIQKIKDEIDIILDGLDMNKVNIIYKYSKCKELKGLGNKILDLIRKYKQEVISENNKRIFLENQFKNKLDNVFKKFAGEFNLFLVSYEKSVEKNIDNNTKKLFTSISEVGQEFNEREFILYKIFDIDKFNRRSNDIINRFLKELIVLYDESIKINNFNKENTSCDKNNFILKDLTLENSIIVNVESISNSIRFKNLDFLNKVGLFNNINAFFKVDKVKKSIKELLEEIINNARNKYEDLGIKYYKNIYNSVTEVREESFKDIYGFSETIKDQVSSLDRIRDLFLLVEYKKICTNSIVEYLKGNIV